MKVSNLKTEVRLELFDDGRYKIRRYGLLNDYPQKCMEILETSGTGILCTGIYKKFIAGDGFTDPSLNKMKVSKNLTTVQLNNLLAKDYAIYQGFAVHVIYNALLQIIGLQHIPFEFCRLGIDDNRNLNDTIGIHDDWGNRKPNPQRRLSPEQVIYVDRYTEERDEILKQIENAGGFQKWKGQVYYFSVDGNNYPRALFDSVVPDMSTEQSVSTVKNRNAKNNFIPAGMFVTYGEQTENEDEDDDSDKALADLQGDEKSFKILHVKVRSPEEKPEFIEFPIKDGDKLYTYTEESIQRNIGKIFNQPPVLRGELIAGKLGTSTELVDAYNYYNRVTKPERNELQAAYEKIMTFLPASTYELKSLEYVN